jgi:hypothetical protein
MRPTSHLVGDEKMEALRKETPLEKARRIQKERGLKKTTGVEPQWLKKYPNITRGQAIQLFCRECMGYTKHRGGGSESQTWTIAGSMVKGCTDPQCPLYIFRPGAKRGLRLASNTS